MTDDSYCLAGLFLKHRPYDYTNDESNLLQGHDDHICTVDLLPTDRARREEDDNNSILPSDWLECTGEIHNLLDLSFGPGNWKSLSMGDLMTQYRNFTREAPGTSKWFVASIPRTMTWRPAKRSRSSKK
jgi:hypothetical protein